MRKKKYKISALLISLSLAAAVFIVLYSLSFRNSKLTEFQNRIKGLEELVTVKQTYRNVIYREIKKNLIVDKRTLFSINYIITAGVDLSRGIKIETEGNSVIVEYSYPEIISIDADEESIDQFFVLQRFGKLKQSDYLTQIYEEKERILEESIDSGILQRADKNFRRLIEGLLKQGGIASVVFKDVNRGETNDN